MLLWRSHTGLHISRNSDLASAPEQKLEAPVVGASSLTHIIYYHLH
uniref:Lkrsdh1 n=1 Tax=Arundo donax TaxID=35708 RepID=A0A0A9H5U7_ARUDO